MEIIPRDVRNYVTPEGREPYEAWVNSYRNRKTRAIFVADLKNTQRRDIQKTKEYWEELRACLKSHFG